MFARCMASAAIVFAGCSFSGSDSSTPAGGDVSAKGQVVDFQTGAAIDNTLRVTPSGLIPAPDVDLNGAAFTLSHIPENSAFGVVVEAPDHWATYSQLVVTKASIDGVKAPSVSMTFIEGVAAGFGAPLTGSKGIVLLHLVDAAGKPRAGVQGTNFTIAGTNGPHFLDANMMAATTALATSTSGWVVFFDVPLGLVGISQPVNATVTIDLPDVPSAASTITVVEAKVSDGAPTLPSNVSFSTQIVPIFANRGCQACHSGGGIGKDLGNLTLDGGNNLIYKELVEEIPGRRVNLANPAASLVLTYPSLETPPDPHPNVTFTGPRDPDYLKLLVWIREGAKQN